MAIFFGDFFFAIFKHCSIPGMLEHPVNGGGVSLIPTLLIFCKILTFHAFFEVEIMKTGKFRHEGDLVDNFLLKVGTVSSSSAYFCLVCIA